MEPGRSPAQLIAESEGLLLDFDGPVCNVYAGSDPARTASELAAAYNLDINTDDPLQLITYALATNGPVDDIHRALTRTEIEAVRTATETPGIRALIETYHGPIAIVSNNASEAIENWLTHNGLRPSVDDITGRDPQHMKPDPAPLLTAAEALGVPVDRCVFVGDSLNDARAAARAGTALVALANKPSKLRLFMDEGCDAIVEGIDQLVPLVRE